MYMVRLYEARTDRDELLRNRTNTAFQQLVQAGLETVSKHSQKVRKDLIHHNNLQRWSLITHTTLHRPTLNLRGSVEFSTENASPIAPKVKGGNAVRQLIRPRTLVSCAFRYPSEGYLLRGARSRAINSQLYAVRDKSL
ncbi:hypothetical protein EVAR_39450_1 [Eumeta japonica]|uniref:Uncharacterized protein n=1 Tax=Eumeta variegata TaxID=151549 RepID=A0A4C1W1L4_EUMVA|nr:hypothetical protein EVAR_39450_1 [Eumeta japonica]